MRRALVYVHIHTCVGYSVFTCMKDTRLDVRVQCANDTYAGQHVRAVFQARTIFA